MTDFFKAFIFLIFFLSHSCRVIYSSFFQYLLYSAPVASALVVRFSCRQVSIVGGVFMTLGVLVTGFAPNVTICYVTFGLISGRWIWLYYKWRTALSAASRTALTAAFNTDHSDRLRLVILTLKASCTSRTEMASPSKDLYESQEYEYVTFRRIW